MYNWLFLAIISGILLGFYDIFKKKALEKISLLNVLSLYSIFSFIFVAFEFKSAMQVNIQVILLIFVKAVLIFLAWIMGFIAIRKLPISIITPFGTLSPLFTIFLGIVVLNERLKFLQVVGIAIIFIAFYFIGKVGVNEINGLFKSKYIYLMAASMFLSATSALVDKIVFKENVSTGQMQFWFTLFLAVLYLVTIIFVRLKNNERIRFKFSWYILLMSVFLVISDRIYFYAVKVPESQISMLLPLRKVSIIVSAIIGGIVFGEKNLKSKCISIIILIFGIAIVFLAKG